MDTRLQSTNSRQLVGQRSTTVGVVAGAILLSILCLSAVRAADGEDVPDGVTTPGDFWDAIAKGHACDSRERYDQSVWYFREALKGQPSTDRWAYAMYYMAKGLLGQGKVREAYDAALTRIRAVTDPAGLCVMGRSAYAAEDWSSAILCTRNYFENIEQWKDPNQEGVQGQLEDLRTKLEERTYRSVWTIDAKKIEDWLKVSDTLYLPLPQTVTPYQELLGYTLEGASYQEKTDGYFGDMYLEVTPTKGQAIKLTVESTHRPYSWRRDLARYQEGPLPDEVQKFLGGSYNWGNVLWIDPAGALAKPLAERLKGRDAIESCENVLRWCDWNLLHDPNTAIAARKPTFDRYTSETGLRCLNGHCEGESIVYVALLRACGIPARLVREESHCIPEFYLNGIGWIIYQGDKPIRSHPWLCPMPSFVRFHYGGEHEYNGVFLKRARQGSLVSGCMFLDYAPEERTILQRRWLEP